MKQESLISKVAKELDQDGIDTYNDFADALDSGDDETVIAIADYVKSIKDPRKALLLNTAIREAKRKKEIAGLKQEQAYEEARSPLIAASEGIAGMMPGGHTLGTAARSVFGDKGYYEQQAEDEAIRSRLKEEFPVSYYGGSAVGLGAQVLAPFGKSASLLGKVAAPVRAVSIGPKALQLATGDKKLKAAAKLAGLGAAYGALEQPEGVQDVGEDILARTKQAGIGSVAAPLVAGAASLGIKGAVKGVKKLNEVLYGLPEATVEAIYEKPSLMRGSTSEALEQAKGLRRDMFGELKEIKKALGNRFDEISDDAGNVDVSGAFKVIDEEILKAKSLLNIGRDVPAQVSKIERLQKLRANMLELTPEVRTTMYPEQEVTGIETVQTEVPGQIESSRWTKTQFEPVDADMQPAARAQRIFDWLEKDFGVDIKGKLPPGASRQYMLAIGKLKGQQLKDAMKQWFNINVPEEKLAQLEATMEFAPIRKTEGAIMAYEPRTYSYPDEVKYTIPEQVETSVINRGDAPKGIPFSAAQALKGDIKSGGIYRDMIPTSQEQAMLRRMEQSVSSAQKESGIPGVREAIEGYDNFMANVLPDVVSVLKKSKITTAKSSAKIIEDIAANDPVTMLALEKVYGPWGAKEIQKDAAAIHAQLFFGQGASPNLFAGYRNPMMRAISKPLSTIGRMGAFIDPLSIAASGLTSRWGVKGMAGLGKANRKLSGQLGKASAYLSGKITSNNEEQ